MRFNQEELKCISQEEWNKVSDYCAKKRISPYDKVNYNKALIEIRKEKELPKQAIKEDEDWDMDLISLELTCEVLFKLVKTQSEITLVEVLKRLCSLFPEVAKDVTKTIRELPIEDITKFIRQAGDTKEHMLFYDILNGDFGYRVMKIMKS
jgi:hypothetical protein